MSGSIAYHLETFRFIPHIETNIINTVSRGRCIGFGQGNGQNEVYWITFGAKMGYLLIATIAKAPGLHLIGQRRPPPDAGPFCAGLTRFLVTTPEEVTNYCTHLPENSQTVLPQPPITTSLFMPSSRRTRARIICVISIMFK